MITEIDEEIDVVIKDLLFNKLIVWNDDYNTFEHVINLLVQICNHKEEQAEQCALIIHTKGKCSVKEGLIDELKPMKDLLIDGGLSVTIE